MKSRSVEGLFQHPQAIALKFRFISISVVSERLLPRIISVTPIATFTRSQSLTPSPLHAPARPVNDEKSSS
jgi:hypothetical protein